MDSFVELDEFEGSDGVEPIPIEDKMEESDKPLLAAVLSTFPVDEPDSPDDKHGRNVK